jgi:hypothetical protein
MLHILEDGKRLLPGLPGLRQLASGMARAAEVGENIGFIEAVAEFPEDVERALIGGGCFAKAAEMVLGVAQAVPGISLEMAVADFRAEVESLSAVRASLLIVAMESAIPADGVEHFGLIAIT